jgi:hypothetical protein
MKTKNAIINSLVEEIETDIVENGRLTPFLRESIIEELSSPSSKNFAGLTISETETLIEKAIEKAHEILGY